MVAQITVAQVPQIISRSSTGTEEVLYKVAYDGTGEYDTIDAAIEEISANGDPGVDKVILVYPGVYSYSTDVNTRLILDVPKTHLKGFGPERTKIHARSDKGDAIWGVVEIHASDCSVSDIWIHNEAQRTSPGNKATALGVGFDPPAKPPNVVYINGIRVSNCKFTGTSDDASSDNLAWDVVTVAPNVIDCTFDDCYMHGYADILSTWAQKTYVNNCTIIAEGWDAIWVTCGLTSAGYASTNETFVTGCRLSASHHYLSGGKTHLDPKGGVPEYYISNCTTVRPDGSLAEIGRTGPTSDALKIYVSNTPYLEPMTIPGGTGVAPTVFPLSTHADVVKANVIKTKGMAAGVRTVNAGITSLLAEDHFLALSPSTGNITVNLNETLPIGISYYGTIINGHTTNTVSFNAGGKSFIHAPGFYDDVAYSLPDSTAHRWVKIFRLDAKNWIVDTGLSN